MPSSPWEWRLAGEWWDRKLVEAGAEWVPSVEFDGDWHPQAVLHDAASQRAPWLYHPCVGAILTLEERGRQSRDLACLSWIAGNTGLGGRVAIPTQLFCWTPGGGDVVSAGSHDLRSLASRMTQDEEEDAEIPLDPWSSIFGYDGQATWAVSEEAPEHVEAEVRKAALVAMRAYAIAAKHLPHIWLWVREFTRVVMPLDGVGRTFRSSSYPEYPGLVLADATSELQLLEALVHESAHHLLYSWEGHGDLIDPDDRTTYSSPLRPDPRPLRGILLAYHALSYIYAFYGDFAASVPGRAVDVAEIDELRVKRDEARETIEGSLTAITPLGRAFLNETANVAAYAA